METKHIYNIALLDGDLLIINPTMPEYTAPVRTDVQEASPHTVTTIAERIHRRETELPHFLLQWSE